MVRFDARKAALAAVLVAVAGLAWWLARDAARPAAPAAPAERRLIDYVIENFTTTTLDARGRPRYRLSARRLTHYADDRSSQLERPYLVQFGTEPPVHTRALSGWMPGNRAEIVMQGEVRVSRGADPDRVGIEAAAERLRVVLEP